MLWNLVSMLACKWRKIVVLKFNSNKCSVVAQWEMSLFHNRSDQGGPWSNYDLREKIAIQVNQVKSMCAFT